MKIAVCSDIHLEFGDIYLKNTDNAEISHLAILPYVINLKIANHIVSDINCALTAASMK